MALKINTTTVVNNSANWVGNSIGAAGIANSSVTRAKLGFGQISANSKANKTTVNAGAGWVSIQSVTITTNGKPVLICGSADMNPLGSSGWGFSAIFRGETQISKQFITEALAASQNQNVWNNFLDTPSAGTHTYSLRFNVQAGSGQYFGEDGPDDEPNIFAVELV
jgi:hypothetical protein